MPVVFSQSWIGVFRPCDMFYCGFCNAKAPNPGAFVAKYSHVVTKKSHCWDRDGSNIGAALVPKREHGPDLLPRPQPRDRGHLFASSSSVRNRGPLTKVPEERGLRSLPSPIGSTLRSGPTFLP